MGLAKQLKAFFLLSILCAITIHKSIPHFYHSHETSVVKLTEADHSHDNGAHHHHHHGENSEEDNDFLLNLLLGNHSHDLETEEDSKTLLTSNKVIVGKDLPIITLFTNYLIPNIQKHISKKDFFESLPNYKQEHLLLNCPLRAPPSVG